MNPVVDVVAKESSRWLESIQNSIPAIVVIRVNSVRAFDGSGASFSHATGFVVDKARGIILTNRHVVTPGPVVADAIFLNKEEVDLKPIYRDPVHDFGFFQFEPSKVKFLTLSEIPLAPHEAKVGVEIRVIGNDAGEKLSILPGILAKLDREAPSYGSRDYNDFNTFYYAAASSTSGGSSGSPVLNIDGHAIALNAGGSKKAASSFYLPLDRAVRALGLLQQQKMIPRGTLQTIFRHSAFDEVRRLGLCSETEELVRGAFPAETGMLVVDQVVPDGPTDKLLCPGDVVIRVQNKLETTFLAIEDYLDSHVGDTVNIEVQRGPNTLFFDFIVQDLHSITPDRYLEMSGCVVHSLSYQQARNGSLPVGGVFLAQAGHMLLKGGITQQCLLESVGGIKTPTLDDFVTVMSNFPDGTRTSLRYTLIWDRHRTRTAIITIDRQWYSMQMCLRDDTTGLWHSHPCPSASESMVSQNENEALSPPAPLHFHNHEDKEETNANLAQVLKSLVLVTFNIPYMIDGISSCSYHGAGVVINVEKGLVLCDQNTVPIALGDVLVTVAASLEIPGKVIFVHPIHNYAIIQYNPSDVPGINIVSEVNFNSSHRLRVGETPHYIGLTSSWNVVHMKPLVTKIERLVLREFQPPRFKATNVEVIHFDRVTKSVGGVFADDDGCVCALWFSFSYQDENGRKEVFRGLPVEIVQNIVNEFHRTSIIHSVQVLPVQLLTYPLAKARAGMKLPNKWVKCIEEKYPDKRQVLGIRRCTAGTDCSLQLQTGDMLLSVDGQVVVKDIDVEIACAHKERVGIIIFRDEKELTVEVATSALSTIGTPRVFIWCGLVIQPPHYAVLSLGYDGGGSGVYCSRWCYGSPAHKYGLRATIWITEVNGQSTPTLDAFLKVVRHLKNGEFVRIKTKALNTKTKVFTLKTDYHYWPTLELKLDMTTCTWKRIVHEGVANEL